MLTSQKGSLVISQPRNPFAWSSFDPVTRSKVITVESGLGTLIPDAITPWASNSTGPILAALGVALPTSGTVQQNLATYFPFYITVPSTVYKLWTLNGATAAGNHEVAIFDSSLARVVTTGSIAQTGTNVIQLTDVTDTELDTGRYYLAFGTDSGTATYFRSNTGLNLGLAGIRGATDAPPLANPAVFDAITSAAPPGIVPVFGAVISASW